MKRIKSEKFFAKEYKDGIIVAFKNIGDNNSIYADQIHQMVSNQSGVDLFVSDIIESISVANSHKDIIKESLFIYVKNGVSISACRISLCLNEDCIEVKYDSEKVLTVRKKRFKRFKRLWSDCILVLLCVLGYYTIFGDDITPDEPSVEIQDEVVSEENAPIETIISNNHKKNESEQDNNAVENIVEVVETGVVQDEEVRQDVVTTSAKNVETPPSVKCHKLEYYHAVEAKVQREREDAERDRQRNELKAEANEYVRIADHAYNDYADSFNESKGIVAF